VSIASGRGRLLALSIALATVALIVVGTLWPSKAAQAYADASPRLLNAATSPQVSVERLVGEIGRHDWDTAYSSLANKSEFGEADFVADLSGAHGGLRTYAALASYDIRPARASSDEADFRTTLQWSTVVGTFQDVRDLKVVRTDDGWQVKWPLVKESPVPPQVVPVNYLRWDVIYRGPADDWGTQDVESPHVRIVDMHPVDRMSQGTVIMGELLNEDSVPAYVTVKATLLAKNGSSLASEDAFDKMSHVLLPKQVTPFRIDFQNVRLSQVDSIRMDPVSNLVGASADPVVAVENQQLNPSPDPSLTGNLLNQSGQTVNIAHVLATFYDKGGQIVWVADGYANRALLPQTPVAFSVSFPTDLSAKISNYRVITSTYSASRFQ
jgi:hypothetical protein